MLQPVIIMLKGVACVISLVYTSTLNLTRKILFQGFQRKEIVAVDKQCYPPLNPLPGGDFYTPLSRGGWGCVYSPLERGEGCVHKTFQGLQSICAAPASAGYPCLSM